MKKHQLLLLSISIIGLNSYAQISFEKGYFIDNTSQKTECLIKNIDWRNNPTEFEYKQSENSDTEKAFIKSVSEFGIYNISRYVRATVNIDRSSDYVNNIDKAKNPTFNEEQLFLKILVEGKSNLYSYVDNNLKRYFYLNPNSEIEQLIFKRYKITESKVGSNNRFRQQLWTDLKCSSFELRKIENIDYKENDLVKFFMEYSACHDSETISYDNKKKRDLFNLNIRPRLNSSTLTVESYNSEFRNTDFGNKTGFGLGLEVEFILPFNKNKWAVAFEPTYQEFSALKTSNTDNISGGLITAELEYSSIELPLSLRHYFFLNDNSKIFLNISYVFDRSLKSKLEFRRADESNINSLDFKSRNNFAFGIGYKLHDKFSLELRSQLSRHILGNYVLWDSDYKTLSFIFGYSIF